MKIKPQNGFLLVVSFFSMAWMPFSLFADEVSGKDAEIRFRLTGLEKFPDYDFYFFKLREGEFQTGDTIWAKNNVVYSNRYGEALEWMPCILYARYKKDHSQLCESSGELGGADIFDDFNIDYIIQEWKLDDVGDGAVFLDLKKQFRVNINSAKEERMKKTSYLASPGGPSIFGIPFLYIVTPLISFILLLWVLVRRIRLQKNNFSSPVNAQL